MIWNEKDGLPSPHTRMLAKTEEGVWVATWGGAGDLIEEPDGSLWLATSSGVARVPAEARRAVAPPPRVRLVEMILNGQSTPAARRRARPDPQTEEDNDAIEATLAK